MSTTSQVENLFFSALDRKTAAERAEFLDETCHGDAELRRKVERLLEAHPEVGDFLSEPAIERYKFELCDSLKGTVGGSRL